MATWTDACAVDDVQPEDVLGFDHGGRSLAICRGPDGRFFAIDGLCSHELVPLADGLVIGSIIECPRHNGRFDYTTGAAKGAPACVDLATYPTKVEAGRVLVLI